MKKGKVLLITPNLKGIEDGVNRIQPSLGFLLIAPILEKNGFDVKIYDSALAGWGNRKTLDEKNKIILIGQSDEKIAKEISDYSPDIVAISVLFSNLLESAHNIAKIVKRVNLANSKDKKFSLLFIWYVLTTSIYQYILFAVNIIDKSNLQNTSKSETKKYGKKNK